MKHRIIAALALLSLLTSSVPSVWAIASLGAITRHAVTRKDHSCCPGLHPASIPALFVQLTPGAMPCGNEHPCCARQRPANPSSMPEVKRNSRPDPNSIVPAVEHLIVASFGKTRKASVPDFSRNSCLSSTVLRI
jgi:hypothetical protein